MDDTSEVGRQIHGEIILAAESTRDGRLMELTQRLTLGSRSVATAPGRDDQARPVSETQRHCRSDNHLDGGLVGICSRSK